MENEEFITVNCFWAKLKTYKQKLSKNCRKRIAVFIIENSLKPKDTKMFSNDV